MKRRVLYYVMQPVDKKPPCVMEICTLKDMGLDVIVLTLGCSDEVKALFDRKEIICHTYNYETAGFFLIRKAKNYLHYRKLFHNFIGRYWTPDCIFWVGSEQSALKMWPFIKKIHPIVLNALEFYEEKWYQNGMRKIVHQVDILTACEPNRAKYMVNWWHLDNTPYVIRNKPYEHSRLRYAEGSTPQVREAIEKIRGKRCLMYQGAITEDRDLSLLAQALKVWNSDFYLILSGRNDNNAADRIKQIYDKTIYLGNIPSPLHLEITSHATICIAFYKDNCINNRYCAPNKIYEYAGCGIPMICNPIPGLLETVGSAGAAECVDFSDDTAIISAINKIMDNYDSYCLAATQFYDSTDNTEIIKSLIEDAFSKTRAEQK